MTIKIEGSSFNCDLRKPKKTRKEILKAIIQKKQI